MPETGDQFANIADKMCLIFHIPCFFRKYLDLFLEPIFNEDPKCKADISLLPLVGAHVFKSSIIVVKRLNQ